MPGSMANDWVRDDLPDLLWPLCLVALHGDRGGVYYREFQELVIGAVGEEQDDDLQVIVSETIRCREIVKSLLDFARQTVPKKRKADINQIIHRAATVVENQLSMGQVELLMDLDDKLPNVTVDANQIQQVFINLLLNSYEAVDTRGTIWLKVEKRAGAMAMVVEDNGPGFQTGSVSQIFDPYVTTKPKGTGLGLAIVKKLVEEHVGSIRASNRPDGGAMISIRLPINEAAREAMIAKAPGRVEKRREQA